MSTIRIPRDISAEMAAGAKESKIRSLVLVELVFDSGTLRLNNSLVNIPWNGNIYYGVGDLGDISSVRENTNLESSGITMTLTGIKQEYISIGLGDHIQGRRAQIYEVLLNDDFSVKKDPVPLGPWKMDVLEIVYGKSCTLTLQCESLMAGWNRTKLQRYTHEEQDRQFPGDKGLEFVADMVTRDFNWGEESDKVDKGMWSDR